MPCPAKENVEKGRFARHQTCLIGLDSLAKEAILKVLRSFGRVNENCATLLEPVSGVFMSLHAASILQNKPYIAYWNFLHSPSHGSI
jgi:hypothetical protein